MLETFELMREEGEEVPLLEEEEQIEKPQSEYFAAQPTDEIAGELQGKVDEYYTYIISSNLVELWRKSYKAYYGMRNDNDQSGWGVFAVGELTPSGDQGEIAKIKINHFSNLITHQLSMTTAQRPSLECRATNMDAKSLVSAMLGNGVLDYYMREKKMEKNYKLAVETALVLSEAYVVLGWDGKGGKQIGQTPQGTPLYDGELVAKNFTPFEVIKDTTKNSDTDQTWYITHSKKNRYDLAEEWASEDEELRMMILTADSDESRENTRTYADPSKIIAATTFGVKESDDVPYMEFYHEVTPAMPNGRYVIFINGDIKLFDGPLPYREMPVYRVTPKNVIGTPFGWTNAFDLLAIQEIIDKLYTCVSSNTLGSGLNNFWTPPDMGVSVTQIAGGRNLIQSIVKPEVLSLLNTPAEVYSFIDKLEAVMEKLSGISPVNRGEVPSGQMSGTAMAFMASQAISFNSDLADGVLQLAESMGTGMINILKDYALTPKMATITGKQNRPLLKQYMGEDLEGINNVVCETTSALSKTKTGSIAIADNLLQQGMIKNPQEYITLIDTGEIEPMTHGPMIENALIQQENEWMLEGKDPVVIRLDAHQQHIMEHGTILSTPESREDPAIVDRVLKHIATHEQLQQEMQMMHPGILAAQGQMPLPQPQQPQGQPMPPVMGGQNPQADMMEKAEGIQAPNAPNLPQGTDAQTEESFAQLQQQQGM